MVDIRSGKKANISYCNTDSADITVNPHNCSVMIPFPEFNLETMPYVLVHTKLGVQIIDCMQRKIYLICKAEKPDFDNQNMAIGKCESGLQVIYQSKVVDAS